MLYQISPYCASFPGRLTVSVVSLDTDRVPLVELHGVAEDGRGARSDVELELDASVTHRHAHKVSFTVRELSVIQQQP